MARMFVLDSWAAGCTTSPEAPALLSRIPICWPMQTSPSAGPRSEYLFIIFICQIDPDFWQPRHDLQHREPCLHFLCNAAGSAENL